MVTFSPVQLTLIPLDEPSHAERTTSSGVSPAEVLSLRLATTKKEKAWAQQQLIDHHYLRRKVHGRSRPMFYIVYYQEIRAGVIAFSRMQSSRCRNWYGSLNDVASGWAKYTQWELLSLSRMWLDPRIQRKDAWNVQNAASYVVSAAIRRAYYEYLLLYPPAFPNEPYALRECISYCQSDRFFCTIYLASNFQLKRENKDGLRTYVREFPKLTPRQREHVLAASTLSKAARVKRLRRMERLFEMKPMLRRQKRLAKVA